MKPAIVKAQASLPAFDNLGQGPDDTTRLDIDTRSTIRKGMWVCVVGFGSFLAWAALAPLDEGVPSDGLVSLETKSKAVQHLSGGIVSQVMVKEGEFVKKNQVLLVLDAANAKARYAETRQHYLGIRSDENRLLSEQHGKQQIEFHPDLLAASKDRTVQAKMRDQQQLLRARQQLLQADITQVQETIRAEQAAIVGNRQTIDNKQAELQLVKRQMADLKEAVDEGYVPRTQFSELQQRETQLNGDLSQLEANIQRSQQLILQYQSKITSRQQAERKDIEEQLARIRLEVDADGEKVTALKNELDRTEIRAPVDGQVIGLQVQAVGAVIQPGQKIMTIVPQAEQLLLDAKIPPQWIDRIATGQPADVRFSAFAHTPQLLVDGKVVSVSSDIMTDPNARMEGGRQYFLARIAVTEQGMKTLGNRTLKPGMPAQVVIKTGERTFLTYMLHPLIKRFAASLKEE